MDGSHAGQTENRVDDMMLSVSHQIRDLTYRTVSFPPLDVQRHRVLGVEAVIVPPGDQPHVAVVRVLPARPLHLAPVLAIEAGAAEDGAGEVGGHGDPVEDVQQVPVDNGVKVRQVWVVKASITLLF